MEFEILFGLAGFVLSCFSLSLLIQNRKSSTVRFFIFYNILSILLPSGLFFIIVPIISPIPTLQLEMWMVAAFFNYCGFVMLFHFLLQHHPTSQVNARRTPFFVFLTILIIMTLFGSQIESNLQNAGFLIVEGLNYFVAAFLFFGYIALEGILYSTKVMRYLRTQRRSLVILLSSGLILVSLAFPFSLILNTWVITPPIRNILFTLLGTGTLLLALALKADQTFPFLIPSQILELGVFDKSGRELFFYRFQATVTPTEMKPGIIIGLQSLLSNLVGETKSPRSGEVEEIKLKDRYILFDYSTRYEFFVIIILTTHLPFIKKILQIFLREFEEKFKDILKDMQSTPAPFDSEKFKEAITIIDRIFTPSKG